MFCDIRKTNLSNMPVGGIPREACVSNDIAILFTQFLTKRMDVVGHLYQESLFCNAANAGGSSILMLFSSEKILSCENFVILVKKTKRK